MSRVDIGTRDVALEAYHVSTDYGPALVPECLMPSLRPGTRPSHQEAYEWIAAHRRAIARAVQTLSQGGTPPAPYHLIIRPDAPAASSW